MLPVSAQIGEDFFNFDNWDGPSLRVFFHFPEECSSDASVIFVFPDATEPARHFAQDWKPYAEQFGFVILIPEISPQLPGEVGHPSAAIDPIFEFVKSTLGLSANSYKAYGYGTGGDFAQQLLLLHPETKAGDVVIAESNSYTMPSYDISWPAGLGGTSVNQDSLKSFFSRRLVFLLGETSDIEGASFAKMQASQRFGVFSMDLAEEMEIELPWEFIIAEGRSQANDSLLPYAVKLLIENDEYQSWLEEANSQSDAG